MSVPTEVPKTPQPYLIRLLLLLVAGASFGSAFWFGYTMGDHRLYTQVREVEDVKNVEPVVAEAVLPEEQLVLTGDVMLGRHVEYLMDEHGVEYPTARITDWFQASGTKTVVNFESAIAATHTRTPSGAMRFSTPTSSLALLQSLNTVAASLANNHTGDYGAVGYQNAVTALRAVGVEPFGHFVTNATSSITYLTVDSVTVALVGFHTLFKEPTNTEVQALIAQAKQNADFVIAYVHWGDEYKLVHNQRQETLAHLLIDTGADLVVGHHPHVTQDIQMYRDSLIFYSLGNFIFDQYFSPDVLEGLLLSLTFDTDSYFIVLQPQTSADSRSQPRLMTTEESAAFLKSLAARSDESLRESIESGLIRKTFAW